MRLQSNTTRKAFTAYRSGFDNGGIDDEGDEKEKKYLYMSHSKITIKSPKIINSRF